MNIALLCVRFAFLISLILVMVFRKQKLTTLVGKLIFFSHIPIALSLYVLAFFNEDGIMLADHLCVFIYGMYWTQRYIAISANKRYRIVFLSIIMVLMAISVVFGIIEKQSFSDVLGYIIIIIGMLIISFSLLFVKEEAPKEIEPEPPCPDPIGFEDGKFIYEDESTESTN